MEAHKAVVEYQKLFEITEYKDGAVSKTRDTGFHIRNEDPLPLDHLRVFIIAKPLEDVKIVDYHTHEDFVRLKGLT
jgi:hypothetical protein